jgi:hypothetical protein
VDHYLLYFRQWLITWPLSAILPFPSLFTESSPGDQLLAPPPSSGVLRHPPSPPLLCVPFHFLVYYSVFFCSAGVSLSRGQWGFIPGVAVGNTMCCLFAHLLVCVSQAGLEPVSGGVGALL